MALVKLFLKNSLAKFWDENDPSFAGFPADTGQAAFLWGEAIGAYTASLTPPSTTLLLAKENLKKSLFLVFEKKTHNVELLANAFDRYAIDIGAGMAPNFTFTPPVPFPIESIVSIGLSVNTSRDALLVWVDAIDAWIRTATATNTSTDATILWS